MYMNQQKTETSLLQFIISHVIVSWICGQQNPEFQSPELL